MQFSYNYIDGHRTYNNGSVLQLPFSVQDYTYSAYAEYGLSKKLTLIANFPYKAVKTYGKLHLGAPMNVVVERGALNAFGNIGLSVSYGLRQNKPFVMSVQLQYDLPTATFTSSTGLRTGYDTYGLAPYINLGFSGKHVFSSLKLGFNFRGNDYSDQLINRVEIGTLLKEQLYLIIGHEVLLSTGNGEYDDGSSAQTGLYANNTEYLAYSLKFGHKIRPQLISWLYLSGGYRGNAVLRSPAVGISISYNWLQKKEEL